VVAGIIRGFGEEDRLRMTTVIATIIVQLADPVRLALMALALWIAWKATDPGWGRVVPVTVAVFGVSALIAIMLRGWVPFEDTLEAIVIGCLSNTLIAMIFIGLTKAVAISR
jgi:hypothetical protein